MYFLMHHRGSLLLILWRPSLVQPLWLLVFTLQVLQVGGDRGWAAESGSADFVSRTGRPGPPHVSERLSETLWSSVSEAPSPPAWDSSLVWSAVWFVLPHRCTFPLMHTLLVTHAHFNLFLYLLIYFSKVFILVCVAPLCHGCTALAVTIPWTEIHNLCIFKRICNLHQKHTCMLWCHKVLVVCEFHNICVWDCLWPIRFPSCQPITWTHRLSHKQRCVLVAQSGDNPDPLGQPPIVKID